MGDGRTGMDIGDGIGSSFMYSALLSLFVVVHVKWNALKISENAICRLSCMGELRCRCSMSGTDDLVVEWVSNDSSLT